MKKTSKTNAKKEIQDFFRNIKNKKPEQVKKIKRLAMRHKISLKDSRKKFCKKCMAPYKNSEVRIKSNIKSIKCKNCEYTSRWRLK